MFRLILVIVLLPNVANVCIKYFWKLLSSSFGSCSSFGGFLSIWGNSIIWVLKYLHPSAYRLLSLLFIIGLPVTKPLVLFLSFKVSYRHHVLVKFLLHVMTLCVVDSSLLSRNVFLNYILHVHVGLSLCVFSFLLQIQLNVCCTSLAFLCHMHAYHWYFFLFYSLLSLLHSITYVVYSAVSIFRYLLISLPLFNGVIPLPSIK